MISQVNTLFFSYWYPNKSNLNAAIFIKRHAQAINISTPLVVLTFNVIHSNVFYKKSINVFNDECNIKTHQIYIESKFYKLFYLLLPIHYLILKRYIKKELLPNHTFKTIHSNILFPCGIIGYWLSNKYKCKHVISEHWSKLDKFFRISLYKNIGKKALTNAYAITCVSDSLKKTIEKYTINKKITIIPNVINTSQFYYDANIEKNTIFTFIAVAHWSPPKNPFYFLEALQNISIEKSLTQFRLVLVGNGPQIDRIKSKKWNFEIVFKGNLNTEELRKELNKSHIFLHGSDYETFSVIIAEALMCGLPSVVSPVGIAQEVINSQNGFVTDNTIQDWKNKILLASNQTYNYPHISNHLNNRYDSSVISGLFASVYK